jgi:hypothetical protein
MPPPKKEKLIVFSASPLGRFREVFSEIKPPKGGLPTMPTRVSSLASDELGDISSRYAAWREFTEDLHMGACATYAQIKSEYDLAHDRVLITINSSTVSEKKAMANTDVEVVKLSQKLVEADIYVGLLARKLESFSNVLAILSRELTRRGIS